MWIVKSHIQFERIDHESFETRDDAEIELHRQADNLAEILGAHVFHDGIGLSTVYDDRGEDYVCFWLAQD